MDLEQNTQPQDDRIDQQAASTQQAAPTQQAATTQQDLTQAEPQSEGLDPSPWTEQTPDASAHEPDDGGLAPDPGTGGASPGDEAAQQLTSAVDAVGTFFTQGASAMREMSAARRAHAAARDELEAIGDAIEDEQAELAHRQDVAARYEEIISTESARKDEAEKVIAACELEQERLQGEIDRPTENGLPRYARLKKVLAK